MKNMNNRGFTTAERLHHLILEKQSQATPTCLCGKPARTEILRAFPRCVGYRCRVCGWEGEPQATLNTRGQMVRATPEGLPTDEVLLDLRPVAPATTGEEILRCMA